MKHLITAIALTSGLALQSQLTNIGYAGRGYSDDIYVIDLDGMVVMDTIIGAGGYRMALSKNAQKLYSTGGGEYVYVSDANADTLLYYFDPSRNGVDSDELEAICMSPDGSMIYVFDESSSSLFVIRTADDSVLVAKEYSEFYEPENCICSKDGKFVYMVDNDDVWKIDTDTFGIVASVSVYGDAHGIALSMDGQTVYSDGNDVYALTADSLKPIDTLSAVGYYLETSKDGARVYGVNEGNTLSVINAANNTVTNTITLSSGNAKGVTTNPSGNIIYVAGSGGVIRLDATSLLETGKTPAGTPTFQSILFKYATNTGIANPKYPTTEPLGIITSLSPNPSNGEFEISYSFIGKTGMLTISDVQGRLVLQKEILPGENTLTINLVGHGLFFANLVVDGYIVDAMEIVVTK